MSRGHGLSTPFNTNIMIDPIRVKGLRSDIQSFIDFVKAYNVDSREVSIATQKLEEAKMWFGKYLGTLPQGGEDLNAKRDEEEVKAAYGNKAAVTPAPATEEAPAAPAEGEDPAAEEEAPEAVAPEGEATPAAEGQDEPAKEEAEAPAEATPEAEATPPQA